MLRKINGFEIEADIRELNAAVARHFEWSNQLIATLLFSDKPDRSMTDTESHLHCSFSKWLNISLGFGHQQITGLHAVEETHAGMHAAMHSLLKSVQSGNSERTLLDAYFSAQRDFLAAVERYKAALVEMRSHHDTLTGLPLRQQLYEQFSQLKENSRRNQAHLYLTLLDVDGFRDINDKHGHVYGDAVLRELGSYLLFAIRNEEKAYRFGGEEFIIIHECENDAAFFAAMAKIMCGIRAHLFITSKSTLRMTVTCGSCKIKENAILQSVIDEAEHTMQYGKEQGRNRAVYNDNALINVICE